MIRRHPLAEQAAEELLRRIAGGEWPIGQKLPGETTLAVQLGVGRSTIREAVRELAGKRVVESRQGAGVFVLARRPVNGWDQVVRRADIADVLEGRLAIESEAARLAAARRTPTDLRAMEQALAHRGHAVAELSDDDYVEADLVFHRSIVTAAHNTVLTELFDTFVPRVRRTMLDMLRMPRPHGSHRVDQESHQAIAAAIRDNEPELAAARSRDHLGSIMERLA